MNLVNLVNTKDEGYSRQKKYQRKERVVFVFEQYCWQIPKCYSLTTFLWISKAFRVVERAAASGHMVIKGLSALHVAESMLSNIFELSM